MDNEERITLTDAKYTKWLMLPGFLAFLFLGLISEGGVWIYWIMLLGGWYLSALIGWHLYKFFMIERNPPAKFLFYCNYILAQIVLVTIVYFFIRLEFGI